MISDAALKEGERVATFGKRGTVRLYLVKHATGSGCYYGVFQVEGRERRELIGGFDASEPVFYKRRWDKEIEQVQIVDLSISFDAEQQKLVYGDGRMMRAYWWSARHGSNFIGADTLDEARALAEAQARRWCEART